MGIDAQILVKNRSTEITKEECWALAVELARICGPETFFMDPMGLNLSPWRPEPFHCLEIIQPMGAIEAKDNGEPDWEGKVIYIQDGPEIFAAPGEQFLEVHMLGRYYGPGYERGNWPKIRTVIECLMYKFVRFRDADIWYGGDSSGMVLEKVTPEWMLEMNKHYYSGGRSGYVKAFGSGPQCPGCHISLANCGGGGSQSFFWCETCGNHFLEERIRAKAGLFLCNPHANMLSRWKDLTHQIIDGKAVKLKAELEIKE